MGVLQALEVIKLLSGAGSPLSRQLLLFDGLAGRFTTVKLRTRAPGCFACGTGGEEAGAAGAGAGSSGESGGGENGGGGGAKPQRACSSRGRLRPEDIARIDYAAFTGQAAHDAAPPPLRVLPPERRLAPAEFCARLTGAGLLAGGGAAAGGGPAAGEEAGPLLVDVRPAQQFGTMALPGAVNAPFDSPERFAKQQLPRLLELAGAAPASAADGGSGGGNAASSSGNDAHSGSGSGGAPGMAAAAAAARQRRPVYVICRRGNHSQLAVEALRAAGLEEVYDLIGGIQAWAEELDPAMPVL
jgi:adenylyltransferase/sulfurtransferase